MALGLTAGAVVGAGAASLVPDAGVACPVLVLRRAIVEVLGGEDEGCQEDAVGGAAQALCFGLKSGLEAVEVDQSGHQGGDLDIGFPDEV